MHPQHTQKMRHLLVRPQSHQRQGCWPAGYLPAAQAFCRFRAAIDDAAAAINHRPFAVFIICTAFLFRLVRREYRDNDAVYLSIHRLPDRAHPASEYLLAGQ